MRRSQKQRILDMIVSLGHAHNEIKTTRALGNIVLAQNIMCECQECAVAIGENIEKTEGEGTAAVSCIEKYCEMLFQMHEQLNDVDYDAFKMYKLLNRQLIKIENSVKNDICIRKEIAFFPYKASMWDSLESIYLEMKEKNECDAYCVPIPYYDLNGDRSFGKLHYEGDAFAEKIEVIDWKLYDYEERRPDEIYIHNPYDNWNLVTSVHPRFYAQRLKKYTEKLIYVPYFILNEINPDNQEQVDSIKHFCFAPGIIYADQIIVQSENMKKVYVNEYMRSAKEHGLKNEHLDRNCLEKKFVARISPKIERLKNVHLDNMEIPQEWKDKIYRADGTRKKVMLYNTGIAALLKYDRQWVEKIEKVLDIFRSECDNIILLWRPHPLIESAMQAMRPDVLERYRQIRDTFMQENWGIYDETPDIDRAIVLSDAYYGDGSSVVELYKTTGKPIMIQNVHGVDFAYKLMFHTYDLCMKENEAWMVSAYFNGLFKINMENGEVTWKGKFPGEGSNKLHLFVHYIDIDNKIYFAPSMAEAIAVYDMEEETFKRIEIDVTGKRRYDASFAHVKQYGEYVYFIGLCCTNTICKYNTKTGELKYIRNQVTDHLEMDDDFLGYGADSCLLHGKLYIPLLYKGYVMVVDLENDHCRLRQVLSEDTGVLYAVAAGSAIWFIGDKGSAVEYDASEVRRRVVTFFSKENLISIDAAYEHAGYLWIHANYAPCVTKIVGIQMDDGVVANHAELDACTTSSVVLNGNRYIIIAWENDVEIQDVKKNHKITLHRRDGQKSVKCMKDYGLLEFDKIGEVQRETAHAYILQDLALYVNCILELNRE